MSWISQLARSEAPELLDAPTADQDALAANLHDLRQIDRYLGSTALTWRCLAPMLERLPRHTPVTLLDVATGGADGPYRLMQLAHHTGYHLRPIASDRLIEVLRLVRMSTNVMPLIRHDALAIPLGDGAIDFVTCTFALHHFSPDAAIVLLREMSRVARCGVIVNDLRRSRVAYWGARLLALGPWHAMARHDGPLSVLRAYTPNEVRAFVERANLATAQVITPMPFRLAIVVDHRATQTAQATE